MENLDSIQTLIEATRADTEAKLEVAALLQSLREDFSKTCGLVIDIDDLKLMMVGVDRKLDAILAWIVAEQSGDRKELKEKLQSLREKTNGLTFPKQEKEPPQMSLPQLRQALTDRFNEEELKTLCFDIGVDYDDLRGDGKAAKVRELVDLEQRHGRVGRLRQWLE